jgi:hypothetical protein
MAIDPSKCSVSDIDATEFCEKPAVLHGRYTDKDGEVIEIHMCAECRDKYLRPVEAVQ